MSSGLSSCPALSNSLGKSLCTVDVQAMKMCLDFSHSSFLSLYCGGLGTFEGWISWVSLLPLLLLACSCSFALVSTSSCSALVKRSLWLSYAALALAKPWTNSAVWALNSLIICLHLSYYLLISHFAHAGWFVSLRFGCGLLYRKTVVQLLVLHQKTSLPTYPSSGSIRSKP